MDASVESSTIRTEQAIRTQKRQAAQQQHDSSLSFPSWAETSQEWKDLPGVGPQEEYFGHKSTSVESPKTSVRDYHEQKVHKTTVYNSGDMSRSRGDKNFWKQNTLENDSTKIQLEQIQLEQEQIQPDAIFYTSLQQQLLDAAEAGNVAQVADLLQQQHDSPNVVDINGTDAQGWTALHCAALHGHLDVIRYLVEQGQVQRSSNNNNNSSNNIGDRDRKRTRANVNAALYTDQTTPLFIACWKGHYEVAAYLIQTASANVNVAQKNQDYTALHICIGQGNVEMVQLLVQVGRAHVNVTRRGGITPLHDACHYGHARIVEILIAATGTRTIRTAKDATNTTTTTPTPTADINQQKQIIDLDARQTKNGATSLMIACQHGYMDIVAMLLAAGANVHATTTTDGTSCLLIAVQNGHVALVEFLLTQANADPNVATRTTLEGENTSAGGVTPLLVAAQNGHQDMVRILLEHGANPKAVRDDGSTALLYACQNGHVNVVKLLLQAGALDSDPEENVSHDAEAIVGTSISPLFMAVQNGRVDIMQLLLGYGAKIDARSTDRACTALMVACWRGDRNMIQQLLARGANILLTDQMGRTCGEYARKSKDAALVRSVYQTLSLVYACQHLNLTALRDLLLRDHNLDNIPNNNHLWGHVKIPGTHGEYALHIVSHLGDVQLVQALSRWGTTAEMVHTPRDDGRTALALAAEFGHIDVVRWLHQQGGGDAIMVNDAAGDTPLHLACRNGHEKVVRYLVLHGADPQTKNKEGRTPLDDAANLEKNDILVFLAPDLARSLSAKPVSDWDERLHEALRNGSLGVIQQLIERDGVNVNGTNESSWMALHLACFYGRTDAAELLLNLGANVNASMDDGTTPLYVACENDHSDVAQVLIAAGANVNQQLQNGATALYVACQQGHALLAMVLIVNGANPNLAMTDGATPMFIASQNGYGEIVELLLSNGALVDTPLLADGCTALFIACQNSDYKVVELLLGAAADVNTTRKDGTTCYSIARDANVIQLLARRGNAVATARSDTPATFTPMDDKLFAGEDTNMLGQRDFCLHRALGSPGATVDDVEDILAMHPFEISTYDDEGMLPLHIAVRAGASFDVVQHLINEWPDAVEATNHNGSIPLHTAASNHPSLELINLLVAAWPESVQVKNNYGWTPLLCACAHGASTDVVRFLMDAYPAAVIEAAYQSGDFPIHALCSGPTPLDTVRCLLELESPAKIAGHKNTLGELPIHKACTHSPLGLIQLRAEAFPDSLSIPDGRGFTLLDFARRFNRQDVLDWLEDLDTDPTRHEDNSLCDRYPLHKMVSDPSLTVESLEDFLSAFPFEISTPDEEGMLAIHVALRSGATLDVVQYLVNEWPESLEWTNSGGSIPIHTACASKPSVELITFMVDMWPESVEVKNDFGWLPLHLAVGYGASAEVVRHLVDLYPASVMEPIYKSLDYPIHLASALPASLDVVQVLLESKADEKEDIAQLRNASGMLPLHKACFFDASLETVKLLVEAHPTGRFTTDENGHTPCDLAELAKRHKIVEWLDV